MSRENLCMFNGTGGLRLSRFYFLQTDDVFYSNRWFVWGDYIVCFSPLHSMLSYKTYYLNSFHFYRYKKEEKHSLLLFTIYLPETKSGLHGQRYGIKQLKSSFPPLFFPFISPLCSLPDQGKSPTA